jgi:hypothetical protein
MIKLSNHDKPSNATMIKILAIITAVTILFPQWFDSIPFQVSEVTKEGIHWVFKGIDMLATLLAVFWGVEKPNQPKI